MSVAGRRNKHPILATIIITGAHNTLKYTTKKKRHENNSFLNDINSNVDFKGIQRLFPNTAIFLLFELSVM